MIGTIYGKSRNGEKVANKLFGALLPPSQEAFTMLYHKNGFQKWVWIFNGSVSSEASEASNGDTSDGSPGYMYTARTIDLASRNGETIDLTSRNGRGGGARIQGSLQKGR
jgi:hypothetical protein